MKSEEMAEGVKEANARVLDFFKGGDTKENMARIGVAYISTYTRLKTTENANKALQCMVIGQVAKDREELKKFVQIAQPGMIPEIQAKGGKQSPLKKLKGT